MLETIEIILPKRRILVGLTAKREAFSANFAEVKEKQARENVPVCEVIGALLRIEWRTKNPP